VFDFAEKNVGFQHFAVNEDAVFFTIKEMQSDIWVIELDE